MTKNSSNKEAAPNVVSKYPEENYKIAEANLTKLYQYLAKMVPDSFEKSQVLAKMTEAIMWNKLAFEMEIPFQPTAEIQNLKVKPKVEEKN